MKRVVSCALLCVSCGLMTPSSLYSHFANDVDKLFEDMEQDLHRMHERMQRDFEDLKCLTVSSDDAVCSTRFDTNVNDVQVSKEDSTVVVKVQLGDKVTDQDVDVRVEGGTLLVLVPAADNLELRIRGKYLTISTNKVVEQEKKDDKGISYLVSSGSAQMSRSITLPMPVKIGENGISADLTNGMLTLKLPGISTGRKIPLTLGKVESDTAKLASDESKEPVLEKTKPVKKATRADNK